VNEARVVAPARGQTRADPVALAEDLLARFRIESPREIEVELMAWHLGASVVWRDAGSADARVVCAGGRAYIAVAKEARGTPRARFSIAHELGHWLMHRDLDAIARIHGRAPSEERDFAAERDADRFGSHVLVPGALAAPMCKAVARPSLADVGDLAWTFRVSLSVAGQRWPRMTDAPCAFFEARAGILRRVRRSTAFGGVAVERRAIEEGTLAHDVLRGAAEPGARVHEAAWGAAKAGRAIVEECVAAAPGVVVGWLAHEA